MELSIRLDAGSGKHLYEQIYEYIREEIRAGRLRPDEKLPSTRALAANLHVARSTVQLAYDQLEAEGYIRMKRNSGALVCGIANLLDLEMEGDLHPQANAWNGADGQTAGVTVGSNNRMHAAAGDAGKAVEDAGRTAAGTAPDTEKVTAGGAERSSLSGKMIDFSPRRIDMSSFPYPTWRRILRGLMAGDRSEIFERGDAQGDLPLRETIAHYLHLSRGVNCSPEQIIVGAGNDYLLMLLARILGEGCRVAMEDPTYLRAFHVFRSMEMQVVPVRQDESGMSAEALRESGCQVAYVMPAHQYPTGVMMPYPRRMELLLWASEGQRRTSGPAGPAGEETGGPAASAGTDAGVGERYIIEDDYDSEFRYRGNPVPALQSMDRTGSVIYIGTFSKSIAPAIRVSFMILPPRLLQVYHEKMSFVSSTVSRIDQSILNEFIRDGYFERYLNRMRNRYHVKHDLCLELLEPFRERFEISGEGAGLHLILTEKGTAEGRNAAGEETRLAEEAGKAGVRVYPSGECYLPSVPLPAGQIRRPQILLGYAALSEEEIREGIRRLADAWKC